MRCRRLQRDGLAVSAALADAHLRALNGVALLIIALQKAVEVYGRLKRVVSTELNDGVGQGQMGGVIIQEVRQVTDVNRGDRRVNIRLNHALSLGNAHVCELHGGHDAQLLTGFDNAALGQGHFSLAGDEHIFIEMDFAVLHNQAFTGLRAKAVARNVQRADHLRAKLEVTTLQEILIVSIYLGGH